MLVLSRRENEQIKLGDSIVVTVVRVVRRSRPLGDRGPCRTSACCGASLRPKAAKRAFRAEARRGCRPRRFPFPTPARSVGRSDSTETSRGDVANAPVFLPPIPGRPRAMPAVHASASPAPLTSLAGGLKCRVSPAWGVQAGDAFFHPLVASPQRAALQGGPNVGRSHPKGRRPDRGPHLDPPVPRQGHGDQAGRQRHGRRAGHDPPAAGHRLHGDGGHAAGGGPRRRGGHQPGHGRGRPAAALRPGPPLHRRRHAGNRRARAGRRDQRADSPSRSTNSAARPSR